MAKHPVFPMWIQDYLADTSHLDATEHGVYHLLLYRYWLTDGRALPEDMAFLKRVTRCRSTTKLRSVLEQFWQLSTGEGWHHRRAQKELCVTRERSYVARTNAKKRWKINDRAYADASNPQCSPTPTPTPTPEEEEEEEKTKKNIKKKVAAKRFQKPTAAEVQAYLDERGITQFTGGYFVDSNEAKGWVVGQTKTPMKCWKSAVRTWETNAKNRQRGNSNGGTGHDRHETRFERDERKLREWYEREKNGQVDTGEDAGVLGEHEGTVRETLDG